jgi:FG-GAP-like repeat/FG-GAP repeat
MNRVNRISIAMSIFLIAAIADSGHAQTIDGSDDASNSGDASSVLIATADFNGDGIADLAEVTPPRGGEKGPATVTVLLGQHGGRYVAVPRNVAVGNDPRSIVAGDLNGDGKPDLLVADGDGSVAELLGDGNGNLVSAGKVAQVGSAVSMAVGDFNHDGIRDLAISDFRSNAVMIFLGVGNGEFRPVWSFALPMRGVVYYLAAADFNGDGLADLAISSDDETSFVVMLGNGNGTFTYAPALSHIPDPNSYCPA